MPVADISGVSTGVAHAPERVEVSEVCRVADSLGLEVDPTIRGGVVFRFPSFGAYGYAEPTDTTGEWAMSLWLTAPLPGNAGGAELVAAALPLARPADEYLVFRPDQPGASCSVIDVEVAAMQALPCDSAAKVDAADVAAGRFLYRLAGHAFHLHWHALMREVSDRFVDVRITEAGMRWGSFPSDGRRVCGVMSGFPFVLGEDDGEWVLVVVGEGGSVLWTSRVPCPMSPWGDLHGGSHMSLLLSSLPDLAAMLALPCDGAGRLDAADVAVGRAVVPRFLRI